MRIVLLAGKIKGGIKIPDELSNEEFYKYLDDDVRKFALKIQETINLGLVFNKEVMDRAPINYLFQNLFAAAKWLNEDIEDDMNSVKMHKLTEFEGKQVLHIACICEELLKYA